MNLAHRAIRRAVKGMLVEAETPFGSRVYVNRRRPVWDEQLPAALVTLVEEKVSIRDHAPRTYERKARLAVTLLVPADPPAAGNPPREISADELLDELGQVIEDVLAFDQCLLGTVADCYLVETLVVDLEPIQGRKEITAGRLVYEVQYDTAAGEGGDVRALFDLEQVRIRWGPKDGVAVGEDHVELEPPGPSAEPPMGG